LKGLGPIFGLNYVVERGLTKPAPAEKLDPKILSCNSRRNGKRTAASRALCAGLGCT